MGGTLSSDSDYDYYDLGRGRVGRLARKERGRGRGRGGLSPASSTEDLTFQCNHCSGTPGRHSHDSDCTHRLVPCPFVYNIHLYDKPCDERIEFANFLIDFESKHGKIGVMEMTRLRKLLVSVFLSRLKFMEECLLSHRSQWTEFTTNG